MTVIDEIENFLRVNNSPTEEDIDIFAQKIDTDKIDEIIPLVGAVSGIEDEYDLDSYATKMTIKKKNYSNNTVFDSSIGLKEIDAEISKIVKVAKRKTPVATKVSINYSKGGVIRPVRQETIISLGMVDHSYQIETSSGKIIFRPNKSSIGESISEALGGKYTRLSYVLEKLHAQQQQKKRTLSRKTRRYRMEKEFKRSYLSKNRK